MQPRKIIFEYSGSRHENPNPTTKDLETTDVTKSRQYDTSCDGDWSHGQILPIFEVRAVILPDWLTTKYFYTHTIDLRYLIAYGMSFLWERKWIEGLLSIPDRNRFAIVQLLKANPERMRSEFRISLRKQVIAWFEVPPDERIRISPLSPRQMEVAVGPYGGRLESQISRSVYIHKEPWGEPVLCEV